MRTYPDIQHFIIFVPNPIIYPFWHIANKQVSVHSRSMFDMNPAFVRSWIKSCQADQYGLVLDQDLKSRLHDFSTN